MLVVVPTVDAEHVLEVAAAEDVDPIETIRAERAYPALGVGVGVWRPDGRADQIEPLAAEHLIEGVAELPVAVMDEKPKRLLVSELHQEVARLLRDPATVRIRGAGDVFDPSRRQRDEEEDVDPLQERGLDGEEVTGEHARRLRPHEVSPRGSPSLWRWPKTSFEQHLPHRRRRDADAEAVQFADDPLVAPVRVLSGETQDQLTQRARDHTRYARAGSRDTRPECHVTSAHAGPGDRVRNEPLLPRTSLVPRSRIRVGSWISVW